MSLNNSKGVPSAPSSIGILFTPSSTAAVPSKALSNILVSLAILSAFSLSFKGSKPSTLLKDSNEGSIYCLNILSLLW